MQLIRGYSRRGVQSRAVGESSSSFFVSHEQSTAENELPEEPKELKYDYRDIRKSVGAFVNHKRFQFGIVILIAINAIMMGIGTFSFVKDNPSTDSIFETIDTVFLVIFTIELGLQFVYHGWRLVTDGWLLFDLVIIVFSWAFAELQIIRAFRIFRALRLITRVRVMQNLVIALFSVMPRMFAIGLLLGLISYIYAVMFTQLWKDFYEKGYTDQDYFGRLDLTAYSLFQIMTFDGWPDIARQVMAIDGWAWLPFISYLILTSFVVVNLLIGVICEAISALRDDEKAKLHGRTAEQPTVERQTGLRETLESLEKQVHELTTKQAETLHSLSLLADHLSLQPMDKESTDRHAQ